MSLGVATLSLQRIAETLAMTAGVHVIPRKRAANWPEKQFVRRLLRELRADCVFDVGANVGHYGRWLRRIGFSGLILSFEPAPDAYQKLVRVAARDPGWQTFNYALGACDAVLPFNVMAHDSFSSFRHPAQNETLKFCADNTIKHIINAPVRTIDGTIDDLAGRFSFARPFLKMDTQGFDLEVVKGAERSLRQFVGMLSEVSVKRIYEGAPTLVESISAYMQRGFDPVWLYPVHPNSTLNPVEFNCYLVRSDLGIG